MKVVTCNVSSEDTVALAKASAEILIGHRFREALPSCLVDFIWTVAT